MSERRESLRLFANSAQTTPTKRSAAENEDNTTDSIVLDGKKRRRSTLVGAGGGVESRVLEGVLEPSSSGFADTRLQTTGKSILKSPGGGPKSPSRSALGDADAVLNSGDGAVSPKKEKGVTFEAGKSVERKPAADRKSKNFRKSLGRRVSFAQTAHIRLFEKDDDWAKSPDNRTAEAGDFNFAGSSSGFQIPDLSSVRRTSDAFDLRLSLPGIFNADTSISSDTSQRSFEIALKGGSPEAHRIDNLASDDGAGRHVLDLSFSTIAPGSGVNSSIPPSPAQSVDSPRRSPRRSSAASAASRRRSIASQQDDGEDLTNNSILSAGEFAENLSEMSMELVECDGGIESMRRISSASLPPIQEGDVLDGLEEEEVQEQEQNQEPEQEQKLAVVEPEEEEMDRSFQQEDPTMDSAAMDETRPIGGISIVVEEEYTFQRPLAQPADEEPAAEAEEAAVEDDESTQDMSIHRFRPSMAPTELPMDLTRPIGGIMRALESDLEEEEEPTFPRSRMSLGGGVLPSEQPDAVEAGVEEAENVEEQAQEPLAQPMDDMTETTEQLQRTIAQAMAPVYTVRLGEMTTEELEAAAAAEEPVKSSRSPRRQSLAATRKSPRRSIAAPPVDVSPLRRRASIAAAVQSNTFSPLRTSFTAEASPVASNRRHSVARFSLGSPSLFDSPLENAPEATQEEASYPGGTIESNSVPVDIMNEEFEAGDDSFVSNDDSTPKGPVTLETFLSSTGIEFSPEGEVEVRRDTNAFLTNQDAETDIAVYVKTNSLDMPELEMVEFGCKELTQYIAQLKTKIQKMDARASEDNPLLFLEFQEADDNERATILHQLKAAHEFSRLVAQEGWYTWEERLLDNFTASLVDTKTQLTKDATYIEQFSEQLDVFLPEANLHLEKLANSLDEKRKSKTKYDAEVMQKLDAVNTDVVRKRTDLAAMPNELLALKEQFAALELKNENMMREKRNITQDIESATKTRDSLKLLSKQEVKEWSDSLNLFAAVHSWKPSGHKTLSFVYDNIVVVSFTESEDSLVGQVSLRFDESRPRLGRKTPCFADRGRRADMKQLHEFFLHNVRGIAASCDVVQLPVTLDRIAQLWDRLRTWERSMEQTRLRSPVRFNFSKLDNVLRVTIAAQGNPSMTTVRCSEDGTLTVA